MEFLAVSWPAAFVLVAMAFAWAAATIAQSYFNSKNRD